MTVLSCRAWYESYKREMDGEKDCWDLLRCESWMVLNWYSRRNQYEKWRFGRWCHIVRHIHNRPFGHISMRSACSNSNILPRLLLLRLPPLGRHYCDLLPTPARPSTLPLVFPATIGTAPSFGRHYLLTCCQHQQDRLLYLWHFPIGAAPTLDIVGITPAMSTTPLVFPGIIPRASPGCSLL